MHTAGQGVFPTGSEVTVVLLDWRWHGWFSLAYVNAEGKQKYLLLKRLGCHAIKNADGTDMNDDNWYDCPKDW